MDFQNTKCPFCLISIENKENIVICSTCKKAHHKDCWSYNLNRCTTFACKGIAIDYDLMLTRNNETLEMTNNTNEIINSGPVRYKPEKALPTSKLKSENKDNKQIIIKNTKLSEIIKSPKKEDDNFYEKVPVPEYIPEYVYDSLSDYHKKLKQEKLKMSSIITKNPYKNLKYKDKKIENNNDLPKAPEYIPEYVNEDIKKYHKRLASEKPKSLIFRKMGNFITDNIKKKREEFVLPRPDPFIPEFVHRDLKEYVKELIEEKKSKSKKRKYKNTENLPNLSINENILFESDIPKPETIIPEYVTSEDKNFDTNFLSSLIKTKKCIKCKKDISNNLETCNFCNSKQIYSNSADLIDYSNIINDLISKYNNYDLILQNKNIYVNNDAVKKIFLSPSSKYITFVNQNSYLRIIDIDTSSIKIILKGHKGKITSALFTQDSKFIYTGSTDTFIKKWDIDSGKCLETLEGHEITVDLLDYSYINQNIISGGGFGILKVWDLNKNKIKRIITDNSKWINTIDYSINNFFFATGNSDNIINIWEANSLHLIKTLSGHLDQITCIKYSPNGYFLASASNDGTIKIWDTSNFDCVSTIKAHTGNINHLDYSPDSKLLVSCGYDKTIKIWNLNNNTCIKILIGHTENINCVKFSPNGKYILSCSDDKTIKIWKLYLI